MAPLDNKGEWRALGCAFAMALAMVALLWLVVSCKPIKEVQRIEVPVVVTQEHTIESVRVDHVRDTLIQRDSIYHYIKGDTTIIERWHHVQGQTLITMVDTLHIYDSVPYPVEVVKTTTKIEEVAKPLRWWQKALLYIGCLTVIGGGLFVAHKLRAK